MLAAGLTLASAACTPLAQQRRPGTAPIVAGATAGSAAALEGAAKAMVGSATAMLGQPYRYGGAAPGGFDCSGLVEYAAANAGIRLPRTAHQQIRAGTAIARRQVRAGDLIFMQLEHKELHVGIAIDARRFVHAPATGRTVRIDSLDAPPYVHAFITARRVIGGPCDCDTLAPPGITGPTTSGGHFE
jgi:cell wall-associated NlpC family hydrolase